MRALRFHAFGGPDVLTVEDVPPPSPRSGEVLVEVHAGGLNFADTEPDPPRSATSNGKPVAPTRRT